MRLWNTVVGGEMMINTVEEKLIRTKAEWNHVLRKLHKAGYTWCNGDSLLSEYEPNGDFPLLIRTSNNRVYWLNVNKFSKSFARGI